MFKFDEYQEIKKAYKEFNRLKKIAYAAERKIRPNDEDSKLLSKEAGANWDTFCANTFAKIIYDTFKDIRPKLYNRVKDCFLEWGQAFSDTWEKCDEGQKNELLSLVLEIGYGVYWLPEDYYDDQPMFKGIKWPTCHTKPFKCW